MKFLAMISVQMLLFLFLFGYFHRKILIQNLAFRQQISIYLRTVNRPKIRDRDRFFWMWLSRLWPEWKTHLVIVQPETVLKWHRQGFSRFWRWKSRSRGKPGRPRISKEHIEIIRKISTDHPEWGEDKIAYEMEIKLGIKHSTSTIRKYRVKLPVPGRGQTWRIFIKNHACEIFSCDFMIQYTVFFRAFYIFLILEIGTRRIVHFNMTDHPSLDWVKQQIREATFDKTPRFLIHDNDGIFGQHRRIMVDERTGRKRTFRSSLDLWLSNVMSITGIPTPYGAPNANAHLERFLRTLRNEALDHFLFFNKDHIWRVVREYVNYYNRARPSQAIHAIPDPYPELIQSQPGEGELVAIPVLGGIHHDYRLAA